MIYRTFALQDLTSDLATEEIKNTLVYASDGAVADFEINEDYLMDNNSHIVLVEKTAAEVGEIITLIGERGEYASGVIFTVDNENLKIIFRSILSIFDQTVLNPNRLASNACNLTLCTME